MTCVISGKLLKYSTLEKVKLGPFVLEPNFFMFYLYSQLVSYFYVFFFMFLFYFGFFVYVICIICR